LLEHFQDSLVGLMPDMTQAETQHFFAEYGDLLNEYPFQVPVNLLFMYRALNIMGSQVKQLDPNFDLTAAALPFATHLLWQTWQAEWQTWLQAVATLGQILLASPPQPERAVRQAQAVFKAPPALQQLFRQPGRERKPQTELATQDRQILKQLTKSIERLTWLVAIMGVLLIGVLWQVGRSGANGLAPFTIYPDQFGVLFLLAPLLFLIRWLLLRR